MVLKLMGIIQDHTICHHLHHRITGTQMIMQTTTHTGAHNQIVGTQMIAELEVAMLINLSNQIIIDILGIGTTQMRMRTVIIR